ncbi:2576_t:CDS:2, partial [Scutellospora calospora]
NQTSEILKSIMTTYPNIWRMMDARYEIMQPLIRGRCASLIKKILSEGYHGNNLKMGKNLHFPRLYEWPLVPKKSDLQLAIECVDETLNDSAIVGYLLDYYSENAMNNAGWMFSVSQAIPDLYDHNMDHYVKELFHKPCFGSKEIHIDMSVINPRDLLEARYQTIYAFDITPSLLRKSDMFNPAQFKKLSIIQRILKLKSMLSFEKIARGAEETFEDKKLGYIYFTVYPPGVIKDHTKAPFIFRLLKILFLPRRYFITKDSECSPFLRAIRRDNSDVLFNNPAIAAIIDYKWSSARGHFLRHSSIYFIFAILFAILTGLTDDGLNLEPIMNKDLYLGLQIIYFYLGYYLIMTEFSQLMREGFFRYLDLYNLLDMASCIMPMSVVITSNVFVLLDSKDSLPTRAYSVALAFTTLIMWGQLLLLLRFFRTTYIYIIMNILKKIWPFLAFMLIVVLGIGHAMYLLLRNPPEIDLVPSLLNYMILNASDTNSSTNNLFPGVIISQAFNPLDISDNYFSSFWKSLESVFFWINGRWDQLDQWNFIPIDILTLLASILLVTIMQNMLIAFMTGVFEDAQSSGEDAVLRYRADLISEFETLEKLFISTRKNPRYIYYVGKTDDITHWLSKAEEYRLTHRSLL